MPGLIHPEVQEIAADQKTISDHKCTDFSIISAITFQNSTTQPKIYPVPKNGLRSQLNDLKEEKIDVLKIGMLPDIEAVEEVEHFLIEADCNKSNSGSRKEYYQWI